jgi:hypothetical protein
MDTNKFFDQKLSQCDSYDLVRAMKIKLQNARKTEGQKIAQCRYCTNSSNAGDGIWIERDLWICCPCADKALKNYKSRSQSIDLRTAMEWGYIYHKQGQDNIKKARLDFEKILRAK